MFLCIYVFVILEFKRYSLRKDRKRKFFSNSWITTDDFSAKYFFFRNNSDTLLHGTLPLHGTSRNNCILHTHISHSKCIFIQESKKNCWSSIFGRSIYFSCILLKLKPKNLEFNNLFAPISRPAKRKINITISINFLIIVIVKHTCSFMPA